MKTLNDLEIGSSAKIISLTSPVLTPKLITMGLLPDREVCKVRVSPLGRTLFLKIGTQYLAIRKQEAKTIIIE